MRFAQTACKFEGLYFSHRFFYVLMYVLETISVNVAEKEVKKNCEKNMETHHILKFYKSLPQQIAALI